MGRILTPENVVSEHAFRRTARRKAKWLNRADDPYEYRPERSKRGPYRWVVRRYSVVYV